MIYFITTEDNKFIKIGYTKNLKARLSNIQTGCPYTLTVLRTVRENISLEKTIHQELYRYHVRGEWFSYNKEVSDYISNVLDTSIEPTYPKYDPSVNTNIEKLYEEGLSNIEISLKLEISIHKVRRVIKIMNLKTKYPNRIKSAYYHHGGYDNYKKDLNPQV